MSKNPIDASVLEKLAQYDTPTICNVIEVFEVRPRNVGYMNQAVRSAFSEMSPMVGFAATASLSSSKPSAGTDVYAAVEHQLMQMAELPGPSVVVFEDVDVPSVGATFGEVMCSSYQAFGSVGLITSGGGRDLEQVRALEYPVFTGSTICSHANSQIIALATDICVGGLTVQNGDLLHGDANGVTNIPAEIADEVADVAEEFIAAELHAIEYAKQPGEKMIAEMVEKRRAMGDAIETLRKRVSRKTGAFSN
jgi:4-hydroxy-4-methyl-2-oxoglutarate aldolase